MLNLLIIGPTNNGKSMLVEKIRRSHCPRQASEGLAPTKSVVVMQTPSDPSVPRFHSVLPVAADVPPGRLRTSQPRIAELEGHASRRLCDTAARTLVIDELHNLLAGTAPRRREFLNVLPCLGDELRIPVVGLGTHEAHLAIRSDDQLENRLESLALPRWRPDEHARSPLASFVAAFPLRRPSPIGTPTMTDYLIDRTEATIGELANLGWPRPWPSPQVRRPATPPPWSGRTTWALRTAPHVRARPVLKHPNRHPAEHRRPVEYRVKSQVKALPVPSCRYVSRRDRHRAESPPTP